MRNDKKPNPVPMNKIIQGDCCKELCKIATGSVDSIITDPPYGMGMSDWDGEMPGVDVWKECLRVLQPGAFAFVFCAPRADLMAGMIHNLAEVGFVTSFTPIFWAFASGFPKASHAGPDYAKMHGAYTGYHPKPAVETVIVAMKPLEKSTYREQAESNMHGITWLGDVGIPVPGGEGKKRFASNLVVWDDSINDHREHKSGVIKAHHHISSPHHTTYTRFNSPNHTSYGDAGSFSRFFDADKWTAQFIIESKPSPYERNAGLERASLGEMCASEPQRPNDYPPNDHPAVKPIAVASYLVLLSTRRGQKIIDPFAGTGTVAIAAELLGRDCVSIERDAHNYQIAQKRIRFWSGKRYAKADAPRRQEEDIRQKRMAEWT